MVKESSKQASTEKAKKPRSSRVKKLVKKPKTTKVAKVAVVAKTKVAKVAKVAKVKPVGNRKINGKPVLAKTTGINISPAKVKNIVSNYVLNKDAYSALTELKDARPRIITRVVDGKEVSEDYKGVPVTSLSQKTLDYIAFANNEYDSSQRDEFAKAKISALPDDARKAYNVAKHSARDEHDNQTTDQYLDNSRSTFNVELFNCQYIPGFYDDYTSTKAAADAADTSDEWKKAIDKVTKLKNRFSTNSRVFLSAFVEYIIKQLALNGTVCCVADKKKIIQLSHILDTTKEGFEQRFPLYPLIVNLDTFKQAQEYLNKPPAAKVVAVVPATTDVDDSSDEKSDAPVKKVKVEKDTDVFTLDGVSLDTQYQFRYYIAESCRETRMDLAKSAVDADGELMAVYNHTSVSKIFKNFCSTLICEFLMRIGNMLAKEIETRGIKTVNDTIIGTVISHYHTVCGVDETATIDFIRTVTTKYYKYVAERQKNRKEVKTAEDASTGGDLPYTE
jgi:hypothetical protein